MDHEIFTRLVVALNQLNGNASDDAAFIVLLLMLAGIIFGLWLSCWIFCGGLSRFKPRSGRATSPCEPARAHFESRWQDFQPAFWGLACRFLRELVA